MLGQGFAVEPKKRKTEQKTSYHQELKAEMLRR